MSTKSYMHPNRFECTFFCFHLFRLGFWLFQQNYLGIEYWVVDGVNFGFDIQAILETNAKKTVLYIGFEVWFKTTTEIFGTLFFFSFLYYFFCFVWLAACKESALFIDCNLCYVSIRMKEEKSNIKTINSHVCIHKYAARLQRPNTQMYTRTRG